ncbi:hypothetical protein DDW07_00945 [Acidilobus sp. SCGC AC-742_E15]|nr:hypothetical protein DDW07_00945 [Acidilobus sp. SCGC AC-742_E15]
MTTQLTPEGLERRLKWVEWAVIGLFTFLLLALGVMIGDGGPLASGLAVDLGILVYLVTLLLYPRLRLLPLGFVVGSDVGHLIYVARALAAKVLVYPPVWVLVSLTGHVSLNVDPVQVLLLAEVVYLVYRIVSVRPGRGQASES